MSVSVASSHGSVVSASQVTVSSIPTKFETTILRGPREKTGFGVHSHRFQDFESDTPAPGM